MKPPSVTTIRGTVTVADALPDAERSLQWVDEVAALLPEESRLGWYRNVRPWLRMLPPDDEVAHLAYSMGYLALLTRNTPELIAAERVQLAALFHRLIEEMTGSVKTTAAYHQKLNDRLMILPGEIAQGLSPAALAAEIVDGVKEQFLRSGVSEAGRQLNEQGDRLRQVVSTQNHVLGEFRQQLNDSRSNVTWVLNSVVGSADAAKRSIDLWNHEMRRVQWIYFGLALLIGVLLGALFDWWVISPPGVATPHQVSAAPGQRPRFQRAEEERGMYHSEGDRALIAAPQVMSPIPGAARGATPGLENLEKPVDVKMAAKFLGVSTSLVYAYVERKQIPHFRMMGRAIRFRLSELDSWRQQFHVNGGINE